MNQFIAPDRVAKLKSYGIVIKGDQILNQLLGIVAQVDSWNRPTLESEFDGNWSACLASHDAHFTDEHKVTANTPENAVADLILAIIQGEAERRLRAQTQQTMGFRSRRPTDKYP